MQMFLPHHVTENIALLGAVCFFSVAMHARQLRQSWHTSLLLQCENFIINTIIFLRNPFCAVVYWGILLYYILFNYFSKFVY